MADISRVRTVAAEQTAIWDVLADFGAISSWADNVDHSCIQRCDGDGVGVGTVRRLQLGPNTVLERITEFAPPRALAYTVEGLPARLGTVTNRWSLHPDGGGQTVVTLTSTVQVGPGPIAGLTEQLVRHLVAKPSHTLLAGLAQRMEHPDG